MGIERAPMVVGSVTVELPGVDRLAPVPSEAFCPAVCRQMFLLGK